MIGLTRILVMLIGMHRIEKLVIDSVISIGGYFMRFHAWFDNLTNTITIQEDDSTGGVIAGAMGLIIILIGLVTAPFFLPFYFLCRYCRKENSIAKRELIRTVGNLAICLCYGCLRLFLHAIHLNVPALVGKIALWLYGTTPFVMFVTSCWCFVTSIIALVKTIKVAIESRSAVEKADIAKCLLSVAINVAVQVIIRLFAAF